MTSENNEVHEAVQLLRDSYHFAKDCNLITLDEYGFCLDFTNEANGYKCQLKVKQDDVDRDIEDEKKEIDKCFNGLADSCRKLEGYMETLDDKKYGTVIIVRGEYEFWAHVSPIEN